MDRLPSEQQEIICTSCRVKFNQVLNYKLHLSSEYHVYNTKRRIAFLEPISEEVFEQKKSRKHPPVEDF